MPEVFRRELEIALSAVTAAAGVCRLVQSKIDPSTLEKKDKSPVTIADYASQAVVCRALHAEFPEIPIVAEEDAGELRSGSNSEFVQRAVAECVAAGQSLNADQLLDGIDLGNHDATAGRYWTLDPIDGTKGFLRKEQYAVSLALIVEGRIEVAALACPNLPSPAGTGVVFGANRGQGAFAQPLGAAAMSRQPVRVSSISELAQARVCESVESGHSSHDESAQIISRLGIAGTPVRMDSQAKYGVVARGDAEIYLRLPTRADYQEKIWDHAGGVLVVTEAGGRACDVTGRPLDFDAGSTLKNNRGVIVTNGPLHERVLAAVKRVLGT